MFVKPKDLELMDFEMASPFLKYHIWWILKSYGRGKDFEIPCLVDFEIPYCFKSHANFYRIPQQT